MPRSLDYVDGCIFLMQARRVKRWVGSLLRVMLYVKTKFSLLQNHHSSQLELEEGEEDDLLGEGWGTASSASSRPLWSGSETSWERDSQTKTRVSMTKTRVSMTKTRVSMKEKRGIFLIEKFMGRLLWGEWGEIGESWRYKLWQRRRPDELKKESTASCFLNLGRSWWTKEPT